MRLDLPSQTDFIMIWISETPFTAEDLEKIEKEMKKIVKEDLEITSIYEAKR